jgi:hypothetical protein
VGSLHRSSFVENVLRDTMSIHHVYQVTHWRSLESYPFLFEYWSNLHLPRPLQVLQQSLDPHHLPLLQRLVLQILPSVGIEIVIPIDVYMYKTQSNPE